MIIPVAGATLPDSSSLLAQQIAAGFESLHLRPRSVEVEAPAWPAVAALRVDLSGGAVQEPARLPQIVAPGDGVLTAEALAITAEPLVISGFPVVLVINAKEAQLQLTRLTGGHQALLLQKAGSGTLSLAAERASLEGAIHELLVRLAGEHGVTLVETKLHFRARGPRALSFQIEVTAKVMMMKAPLAVAGDLDLDESLELRVSNLQLTGGGMAASLARGFLQPQFDKIQAKPISLSALAMGEVRLRDVALSLEGETLRLNAKFGG